jgi:hypothetical protein
MTLYGMALRIMALSRVVLFNKLWYQADILMLLFTFVETICCTTHFDEIDLFHRNHLKVCHSKNRLNEEAYTSTIGSITNSIRSHCKLAVGLGQGRRIKNGADAIFSSSLTKPQPGSRSMSHNIPTNGLGRILGKAHGTGVGYNLIGHEDSHTVLFCETCELPQELGEVHLSFGELATTRVVSSI